MGEEKSEAIVSKQDSDLPRRLAAARRVNLSKAGWSWGRVSAVDSEERTIWIADAHRGDCQRFVVHADEKLTAFMELERAICIQLLSKRC
jgi:hypothetical protein